MRVRQVVERDHEGRRGILPGRLNERLGHRRNRGNLRGHRPRNRRGILPEPRYRLVPGVVGRNGSHFAGEHAGGNRPRVVAPGIDCRVVILQAQLLKHVCSPRCQPFRGLRRRRQKGHVYRLQGVRPFLSRAIGYAQEDPRLLRLLFAIVEEIRLLHRNRLALVIGGGNRIGRRLALNRFALIDQRPPRLERTQHAVTQRHVVNAREHAGDVPRCRVQEEGILLHVHRAVGGGDQRLLRQGRRQRCRPGIRIEALHREGRGVPRARQVQICPTAQLERNVIPAGHGYSRPARRREAYRRRRVLRRSVIGIRLIRRVLRRENRPAERCHRAGRAHRQVPDNERYAFSVFRRGVQPRGAHNAELRVPVRHAVKIHRVRRKGRCRDFYRRHVRPRRPATLTPLHEQLLRPIACRRGQRLEADSRDPVRIAGRLQPRIIRVVRLAPHHVEELQADVSCAVPPHRAAIDVPCVPMHAGHGAKHVIKVPSQRLLFRRRVYRRIVSRSRPLPEAHVRKGLIPPQVLNIRDTRKGA